MNHQWVAAIAFLTTAVFVYMLFNLPFQSEISYAAGMFGVLTLFLMGIKNRTRYWNYIMHRESLPLESSAEDVDTVDWYENMQSHKHLFKMGLFVLLIGLTLFLAGCGGRFMFVEYGLNRMAAEDKVKLNKVLSNNPDGRRSSWYNKASNSHYTITPVYTFLAPGGQDRNGDTEQRLCRQYLIDDVYPYNAPKERRGHMQIEDYACYDQIQQRWYAVNGFEVRPFIRVGGPNYFGLRRN